MDRVRIGCLGAARIAPAALIKPARASSEVEVTAVAARDPERGRAFATKHGVPVVHDSDAALLAGCYAVHMLRTLAGGEPEVVSARAKLRSPGVDRAMRADMRFGDGRTGRINTSMWSTTVLRLGAHVEGEAATLKILNPIAPQYFH